MMRFTNSLQPHTVQWLNSINAWLREQSVPENLDSTEKTFLNSGGFFKKVGQNFCVASLQSLESLDASLNERRIHPITAWNLAPCAVSPSEKVSSIACRILRENYSVMPVKYGKDEPYPVSPVLLAVRTRIFPPELADSLMDEPYSSCPIGIPQENFRLLERYWEGASAQELFANDKDGKILGQLYQALDYCGCPEEFATWKLVYRLKHIHAPNANVTVFLPGIAAITSSLTKDKEVEEIQRLCRLLAICEVPVRLKLTIEGRASIGNLITLLKAGGETPVSDLRIGGTLKLYKNQALCRALQSSDSLTELHLQRAYSKIDEAENLAEILRKNKTLRHLDLSVNPIRGAGAKIIAKALEENETLEELVLWRTALRNQGAVAIAQALKNNKTLKRLNLRRNGIRAKGIEIIADILKENDTLKEIDLRTNIMGRKSFQLLRELRAQRPDLNILF